MTGTNWIIDRPDEGYYLGANVTQPRIDAAATGSVKIQALQTQWFSTPPQHAASVYADGTSPKCGELRLVPRAGSPDAVLYIFNGTCWTAWKLTPELGGLAARTTLEPGETIAGMRDLDTWTTRDLRVHPLQAHETQLT